MARKPIGNVLRPKKLGVLADLLGDGGEEAPQDDLADLEDKPVELNLDTFSEVDLSAMVEAAIQEQAIVPRDLKFDDSSMPKAKNFLEWTSSPNFLNASPFLEQALIGIRFFAEFCPICSPDPEWILTENHEAQEGLAAIPEHIVMLEHGKCPQCGIGRAKLIRDGHLHFYNELAVNAGQRCVVGNSPVLTGKGLQPISHLVQGHTTTGFHKAAPNITAHNGKKLDTVKQVFISADVELYEITLSNGMFIRGTGDHPVRTERGFRKLKSIFKSDSVGITLGTHHYGTRQDPTTIFEAGTSTRDAALDYLLRNSICTDQHCTYMGDEDSAQMAVAILVNMGIMPNVVRQDQNVYVEYVPTDFVDSPRTVFSPVRQNVMADPEITFDLVMSEIPQFICGGMLNHNSGKSVVVAMMSTYQTHILLKAQDPIGILGIDASTTLHGTFVALTAKQATETLWKPYYDYILESPWFQRYHALIKTQERKYGITVVKIRDTFISYGHRKLLIYPAGPDGRSLRGRTRFLGALDEIAYFDNDPDSKKVKVSANLVYTALDRSMLTVRAKQDMLIAADYNEAFTGIMMNVSSPLHARDKINELLRQSVGSRTMLGIHAPTWKMNPSMPRNCTEIMEAFRKDPVSAARDYGAEAPMSANPFLTQIAYIEGMIRDKGRNQVVYQHHFLKHKNGKSERYAKIVKAAPTSRPSIMAIDAGHVNNSFSLVVGSRNRAEQIEVDCVIEVMAKPDISLNFNLIYEHVIKPLCAIRNVKVLLADQWQSIKLLQDAMAEIDGLEFADKYSLKYSDLWAVKTLIETPVPRLTIPRLPDGVKPQDTLSYDVEEYPHCFENKPIEHLVMQLQTVQDTGRSVIKDAGATDDSWRSMALMVYGFECGKYDEVLIGDENMKVIDRNPNRLGISGGRRDGSSGYSSGGSGSGMSLGVASGRLSK